MDVFSLLKFWRNAGVGDPIHADDFDEEVSFFELVFDSSTVNVISGQCSKLDGGGVDHLKSNPTPHHNTHTLFFNHKRKISSSNSKTPRSPFRVFMLGFQNNNKSKKKKKEMQCQVAEEVTNISSLLKHDTTLRRKLDLDHHQTPSKRFSKDAVHRYLNLINPNLYIKVSRTSNDKHSPMMFSPSKEEKPTSSVFKEVRKHLGKSRSSSSNAVKPIPSPAIRRDDSALQQQDGIQSAILHCKRSYNSPSQGCCVLSRSGSAPSQGTRISVDEEKRSSI